MRVKTSFTKSCGPVFIKASWCFIAGPIRSKTCIVDRLVSSHRLRSWQDKSHQFTVCEHMSVNTVKHTQHVVIPQTIQVTNRPSDSPKCLPRQTWGGEVNVIQMATAPDQQTSKCDLFERGFGAWVGAYRRWETMVDPRSAAESSHEL